MRFSRNPALDLENKELSPEEFNRMSEKLSKALDPKYISSRAGPRGVRLFYLEGWRIIEAANEVFGFNGWSHSVTDLKIDYNESTHGRYNMGASAVVRVTLKDGAYHEDIGYGFVDNAPNKGLAYSKVKKAAVTDATKRALKSFGKYLGNCINDREYIESVVEYGKQRSNTGYLVKTSPEKISHQTFKQSVSLPATKKRNLNIRNTDVPSKSPKTHYSAVIPTPNNNVKHIESYPLNADPPLDIDKKPNIPSTQSLDNANITFDDRDDDLYSLEYDLNIEADLCCIDADVFAVNSNDVDTIASKGSKNAKSS